METASKVPFVTLNSGYKMPQVGLGTFLSTEGDIEVVLKEAIINQGYRHIDTARIYNNEEAIGRALQECFAAGIKREDLFIVTKLWQEDKGDIEGALRTSLKKLQLDYIDLYLVHWTVPHFNYPKAEVSPYPNYKVWAEMERMVELGLTKSIGVSNATIAILMDMLAFAKIRPANNQLEVHPYLVQEEVLKFHNTFGISITAYAPIGSSHWNLRKEEYKGLELLKEPLLVGLAEKYGKSPAQIVLNWHLHRGIIVIPKTTKVERLAENLNVFDFKLEEEEYKQISGLNKDIRLFDAKYIDGYGWDNLPYFD